MRLVLVNVAAWAVVHVAIGYGAHRLPVARFAGDAWLYRIRRFEDGGRFYARTLRIGRWKSLLPEAGAFFAGGFAKRTLGPADPARLARFVAETRRAELAHWLMLAAGAAFFAWNPWPVALANLAYAVAANVPCVAAQRYNRVRLLRVLARTTKPTTAP